jgi:hypothetical protein
MNEFTTGDVIIGGIASVGVLILLAVFVYVVRDILTRHH